MSTVLLRSLMTIAFGLVLFCCQAVAVTKTWTPFFGSDDWQFGLNWDPGGVPGAADDVIINVANDLVALNDDTTLVDSILLANGADIRTNGHTLNLNNTGNSGIMTVGNGVNLSRLQLEPEAVGGKSADLDILQINNGGQLDMDGGLLELDNQLVMSAGAEIVGHGTIQYQTDSATALFLRGTIDVDGPTPVESQLRIVSLAGASGGEVDMGDAFINLERFASLQIIDANIRDAFDGSIALDREGEVEITQDWELAGDLTLFGASTGGTIGNSEVKGGLVTVSGELNAIDAAHLIVSAPTDFLATSRLRAETTNIFTTERPEIELQGPTTFRGGTIDGNGILRASGGTTIAENTTIDGLFSVDFTNTQVFQPGLTINAGRTLEVRVFGSLGNVQPTQATIILEQNARYDSNSSWEATGILELFDGASITGSSFTKSGTLRLQGGESVITASSFTLESTTLERDGTLRVESSATYGGVIDRDVGFTDATIIQNGNATVRGNTTLLPNLFAIGGSAGATTTVQFNQGGSTSHVTTTGEVSVAAGLNSTAELNVQAAWQTSEPVHIGGSATSAGGIGTLTIVGTSLAANPVAIDNELFVYAGSTLHLLNEAELFVRDLTMQDGSTLNLEEGLLVVEGGTADLPNTAFAFGALPSGGGTPQFSEFRVTQGGVAEIPARFSMGDLADSNGRTEVLGLSATDNPSTLRNTSNGSSADLFIGDAGNGELLIAGGGLADIGDDIILGSQATSIGTGEVDGVQNGVRSTLRTRTSGSAIAVGQNGSGSLDITDGALVESARNVFIAQFPGGSGQIHLFQTNSPDNGGFDSQLVVGDDLVVGGGTSNGGAGTLIIDEGGRVDVLETIIVRSPQARMTVDGGRFTAARFSHTIGGTVELNSGRGEIQDPTINFPLVIGEDGNQSTMELVITGQGMLDDLTIVSNGILNVSGRVDVEVLNPGTGAIVLNGGTLAINAQQPGSVGYPVVVSASNGTFEIADAFHFLALDGDISSTGSVIKTGAGRLLLSGNNSFIGPMVVNAGTVVGNSASIPGDVQNATHVEFLQILDGAHNGVISGVGSIEKTGGGTLTLDRANTYSGDTVVDEGTLLANNGAGLATGTGNVFVNSGGTLGGTGSVGDVIVSTGGQVNPGTSIGVLNIESLDLASGGTLAIDIAGTLAGIEHDQVEVDLSVDLTDGTLDIDLADGYLPNIGDTYTLIEAAGSIAGTFAEVIGDAPVAGLEFDVIYNTNSVLLEVVLPSSSTADFDNDGDVDAADLTKWQNDYSGIGSDSDGDGDSDGADFLAWQQQFGSGVQTLAGTQVVPEPTPLSLACVVLTLVSAINTRNVK